MPKVALPLVAGALLALGAATASAGVSPAVGEPAPEVSPSEWLNVRGPLSWEALQGKAVIVYRWATW